jgi:tight adherence protein B
LEGAATPGGRRSLFLDEAEKSLGSRDWWTRFQEELEIAQVKTPAIQIVAAAVATTVVAFALIYVVSGSILFGFIALTVPFFYRSYYRRKLLARRKAFSEQLPDSLAVIASALRAGHSLASALSVVVENASDPMKSELQRVIAAEQLGSPLDDALMVVVKRMDNRDLEQLAFVAKLQRDAGASAAEVIDRVTDNVRERFELRRLVRTLTAQGRLSRWIVSLLPLGLLLILLVLNPTYIHPLFSHTLGRVALVFAVLLVIAGSYIIGRIVDIKV